MFPSAGCFYYTADVSLMWMCRHQCKNIRLERLGIQNTCKNKPTVLSIRLANFEEARRRRKMLSHAHRHMHGMHIPSIYVLFCKKKIKSNYSLWDQRLINLSDEIKLCNRFRIVRRILTLIVCWWGQSNLTQNQSNNNENKKNLMA